MTTGPIKTMPIKTLPNRGVSTNTGQLTIVRPQRTGADLAQANVANIAVSVVSMGEAVEWLHRWAIERRGALSVRLVNAFSIVSAHRDPAYLRLMRTTGVSLPDGTPVMLAMRAMGGQPTAGRVRGPSLFMNVLSRSNGTGVRHFFLGTTDETLTALTAQAHARWADLTITGAYAPPFGVADDAFIEMCRQQVEAVGADCVWVALGTPKQDFVAEQLAQALGLPCVAVGAAFDFLAGTKREAPRVLQSIGAEWIFRLFSEPRRLWRRYVFGNIAFLRLLIRERR